jgi:hypothetical protein
MQNNQFHFVTRWRFQASADVIFALLNRPLAFPDWWGTFFLRAELVERGDEHGIDRLIRFQTKSSIPAELNWGYRTLALIPGRKIALRISGDFAGEGLWLLEEDGIYTDVIFDWNVCPEKKLLKEFAGLWKPVIRRNHRWGMEQGRIALEKEMAKQNQAKREVKIDELPLLDDKPQATPAEKVKGHAAGH